MFSIGLPLLIGIAAVIAQATVLAAIFAFRNAIPSEDRQYMDPLTPRLKLVWPLVRFFSHYFGRFLSVEYVERTRNQLVRSGLYYILTPDAFFGLKMTSALLMGVISFAALKLVGYPLGIIPLVAALFGFYMPSITMTEKRKEREQHIVRLLPTYLDFITMSVEAGLNLGGALVQAVRYGPEGPLKSELDRVNRDIKAGMSRGDSLRSMATRLDIKEITNLVSAISQAEKTGASIGQALRIQADQRRTERFLRAEKLAMEAPVKLIFPLVAFIFPTTFIVLGFPIAMKFLHGI